MAKQDKFQIMNKVKPWRNPVVRYQVLHGLGPTMTRAHPKVGRNEPCPCGSGKKFKKCHGA